MNYKKPAVVRASFIGASQRRMGEDVSGVDSAVAPGAVDISVDPTERDEDHQQQHVQLHLAASTARLVSWTRRDAL